MPIPDPLRDRQYASGALIQQCADCHWAQRGHQAELSECPACGNELRWPVAITFGGTAIVYRGKSFYVHNNNGQFWILSRADIAEIVQFICRHAEDRRGGARIRDAGELQRVAWRPNIEDHLWGREDRRVAGERRMSP